MNLSTELRAEPPRTDTKPAPGDRPAYLLVVVLSLSKLALHLALSGGYGYFRDELYYLACGRHLAWGYVDQAPMIAFVARIALWLGASLPVLRVFPAIAGALLVALTMLLTWRLGGGRFAQAIAGLTVIFTPIYLAIDSLLTMNAFEPLFWMGCIYVLIRIVQTGDSRLWLWFGVFAGLGLMNKHSTGFFGLSVAIALLFTRERKEFAKPWIWIALAIALLIFSPNLIWQIQHHFPTIEDLRNVQVTGKNVVLPPLQFIWQQIMVMHPVLSPIWLAGLWHFFFGRGRRYRLLGWIFVIFFLMMMFLHGKDYYVVPIYPVLIAGGTAAWEGVLQRWRFTRGKLWAKAASAAVILVNGAILAPLMLPLLPPQHYQLYAQKVGFKVAKEETQEHSPLPQFLSDQFGWPGLVRDVAQVYDSLPPEERAQTGILTGNYGEAGAVDFFGKSYALPSAVSGHQTYFYWSTHGTNPRNLLTLQYSTGHLSRMCESVEQVGVHDDRWGMAEENQPIYYCRGLKASLAEIWPSLKHWN